MKPYRLFWLVKGDIMKIGDTITSCDCGSCYQNPNEGNDYEVLDSSFNTKKLTKELASSIEYIGEQWINSVIYITNNSNRIVGIIPINYKERK